MYPNSSENQPSGAHRRRSEARRSVPGDTAHTDPADEELVRLCIQDDEAAWEALIRRYSALMYSIPREFGFDDSECKDVVQNVCIKLVKRLKTLRDPAKVYSWLMTVTTRQCLALVKQKDAAVQKQQDLMEDTVQELLDPAGNLEEILLWAEKQQLLREILKKWPDPCSLLIQTLYFEQRSYEETAQRLGVAPDGIGARLGRCLERLRWMLSKRGITNPS